jgi:hypothetical protein
MPSRNTFPDLDAVKRERGRLLAERDRHSAALRGHWELMRQPSFRRRAIGAALTDVLKAVRPLDHLAAAFGPARSLLGTVLGVALGSQAKGAFGKAALGGLGMILPGLWDGARKSEGGHRVLSELGRSWQRIKDRLQQRRDAPRE